MVSMHVSDDAPIKEPLGIAFRGGPINGPFGAGAAVVIDEELERLGIKVAHIYGVSAGASVATMAAVKRSKDCRYIWSVLTPGNIIDVTSSWLSSAKTVTRLVRSESIFPSTGLEKLVQSSISADELYSPDAIPVSIMTVDYDTGDPIVFTNTEEAFYPVFRQGILASMALTPFLRLQVIWAGPKGLSSDRQTPYDMCLRLMDGGYRDNLMIEHAARDGINTLLVVDVNGLHVASPKLGTHRHWSGPLQMAFHTLITTNDQRNLYGATRVNEELAIRDELARVAQSLPAEQAAQVSEVVDRMDNGRLELAKKHHMRVHLVHDRTNVIPFDFAHFSRRQTTHLITAGERAAARTMGSLR